MELNEALLAILGLVVTVSTGSIVPFAISVSSRLARIEAMLQEFPRHCLMGEKFKSIDLRIGDLSDRLIRVEEAMKHDDT